MKNFASIFIVLLVLLGCNKSDNPTGKSSDNLPTVNYENGDAPLSDENVNYLDGLESPYFELDDLTDFDGNPFKKTTNQEKRKTIINAILKDARDICSKKQQYAGSGDNSPTHNGLVYSAGQRDIGNRLNPPVGNGLHRKFSVYGTDCSGLMINLFQHAGIAISNNTSVSTFETQLATAIKANTDLNGIRVINLGNLKSSEFKKGDIIIWNAPDLKHIGLITFSKNGVPIIFQCNGTGFPKNEADQQKNLGLSRGARPLYFSEAIKSYYWGSNYSIIRMVEAGEEIFGGLLFYLSEDGKEALICASQDQSTGMLYPNIYTPGTLPDIGRGKQNTALIINEIGGGSNPANLCDELILNGFEDWYLPSVDELHKLWSNLHYYNLGNFASEVYWSSTDIDDANSGLPGTIRAVNFNTSFKVNVFKNGGTWNDKFHVRAIRTHVLK